MKDAENNAEKEETIQWERENGKKSNKYNQRAVRGKERESSEEKRCKEKGKTGYIVKAVRGRYKRDFFYYFVYTLHIENENINFVKQEKQTGNEVI